MKSTFTSIVLRTANIPAFIVYPFDTLYHSFLIYSKPFRRSMYILFSRASHPAASAVSSAAKFSLLASSAMVISPVSPNFSKMIPALNPALKSAKRFFLQYVKTRSVYDCTKITNCWLKGFMNLLFFCLIILKFSVYEIPSSFRTSSFADEKKPLQCLNSVFAFSKSSPCFLSVSKRA